MYGKERSTKVMLNRESQYHSPPEGSKENSLANISKYYSDSSLVNQKHGAIKRKLRKMWIWFSFIIFIGVFDVVYNLYWHFIPNFTHWDSFTHSRIANAWIFLISRFISLQLAFFPIVSSFLGGQLILALMWFCCRKRRRVEEEEENIYYEDL